jgi:hypothetical protein
MELFVPYYCTESCAWELRWRSRDSSETAMEKKESRKAGNCSDEWQTVGWSMCTNSSFLPRVKRLSSKPTMPLLCPPKDPATAQRSKWCLSSAILRNSENPFRRGGGVGGGGGIREFHKSFGGIEVGGIGFQS